MGLNTSLNEINEIFQAEAYPNTFIYFFYKECRGKYIAWKSKLKVI